MAPLLGLQHQHGPMWGRPAGGPACLSIRRHGWPSLALFLDPLICAIRASGERTLASCPPDLGPSCSAGPPWPEPGPGLVGGKRLGGKRVLAEARLLLPASTCTQPLRTPRTSAPRT